MSIAIPPVPVPREVLPADPASRILTAAGASLTIARAELRAVRKEIAESERQIERAGLAASVGGAVAFLALYLERTLVAGRSRNAANVEEARAEAVRRVSRSRTLAARRLSEAQAELGRVLFERAGVAGSCLPTLGQPAPEEWHPLADGPEGPEGPEQRSSVRAGKGSAGTPSRRLRSAEGPSGQPFEIVEFDPDRALRAWGQHPAYSAASDPVSVTDAFPAAPAEAPTR